MKSTATLGFDSFNKTVQLSDGSLINCLIYDTAGQERYNALNYNYYKKANAVLLVYDITQKKTFEKVKNYYINEIKNNCKDDVIVLLLANKTDLEKNREVTSEEGINLAKYESYEFKESSCSENKNVAGAFEYLVETWNFGNKARKDSSFVILEYKEEYRKKKKKGCCN